MDSDEKIRAGREAKAIIENPLVKDFFDNYIQHLFVEWSSTESPQDRERIWNLSEAAKQFKRHFTSYIISGNIEERKNGTTDTAGSGSGTGTV